MLNKVKHLARLARVLLLSARQMLCFIQHDVLSIYYLPHQFDPAFEGGAAIWRCDEVIVDAGG
jgi:hypothetical protein